MPAVLELPPVADDYTPHRMGLISRGHRDPWAAAVALAANRASKIAKLADAGHLDMAARYKADLDADVADFLARRDQTGKPAGFEQTLFAAAAPQPIPAPAAPFAPDTPVRLPNGFTGTVSHTFPSGDGQQRIAAVTVTRTSQPPHPRHGAQWTELYASHVDQVTVIDADQVTSYPYTELPS